MALSLRAARMVGRAVPKNAMSTMAEEFPSTPASVAGSVGFSDVQTSTLSNGIKVVSKETGSAAVSVGVSMAAGSKYGSKGEALLLKHLAFKGTATRSDIKLARDLENAGVGVAATAGRDTVLLSASGVPGGGVLEVGLAACAEGPFKLAPWHVAEVKAESVGPELKSAGADPMRLLVEKLHEAAYGEGTPMGAAFYEAPSADAADLSAYLAAYGGAGSLTVVGAGGVSHADLVAAAEAALGGKPGGAAPAAPGGAFVGGVAKLKAESPLTHVAVALAGAPTGGAAYFDALVLKECLASAAAACGGSAFSVSYADSGLVGLYGACPPSGAGQLAESFAAALKAPPTDAAVAAAKLAVKTQLAVAAEGAGEGLLAALADGTAAGAGVDGVTAGSVKALAAAALKGGPALATVGPAAAVPSHATLAGML